jgi:hypothetical protein
MQSLNDNLTMERAKVARLERETTVIRNLGAQLQVTFQGNWKDKTFPIHSASSTGNPFYVYLKSSIKSDVGIIKLYQSEDFDIEELQPGTAIFQIRQNARTGEFPLGN